MVVFIKLLQSASKVVIIIWQVVFQLFRKSESTVAPQHLHDVGRSFGQQHIFISGTTQHNGLGFNVMASLNELGHKVATLYRSDAGRDLLRSFYPNVMSARLDLLDCAPQPMSIYSEPVSSPFNQYAQWVTEKLGKLDVVIINAAETGLSWLNDIKLTQRKIDAWVYSNQQMIDNLLLLLHDFDSSHPKGRVIFVSSVQAHNPRPGLEAYGEVKRRTEDYIKRIFADKALSDILPIIILPGSCATNMHHEVLASPHLDLSAWRRSLAEQGAIREPACVGKIITGVALTGCGYNPETARFDLPIQRFEKYVITDEVYNGFCREMVRAYQQLPRFEASNFLDIRLPSRVQ